MHPLLNSQVKSQRAATTTCCASNPSPQLSWGTGLLAAAVLTTKPSLPVTQLNTGRCVLQYRFCHLFFFPCRKVVDLLPILEENEARDTLGRAGDGMQGGSSRQRAPLSVFR